MRYPVKKMVFSAALAALYVALSLLSSALGLGFGPVQLRLSEALCVLPWLYPGAVPGLVLGCLLSNLLSPFGAVDLALGSAATLLGALLTARMPKRALAPLPPVLCNAVIVGAVLTWYQMGLAPGFWGLYPLNALTVGLGEAFSCYGLGGLVLKLAPRTPLFRDLMKGDKP